MNIGLKTYLRPLGFSSKSLSIMSSGDVKDSDNRSIHSDSVDEVHNVPMDVIIRPFPPVLDEQKVQSLMDTIKVIKYTG